MSGARYRRSRSQITTLSQALTLPDPSAHRLDLSRLSSEQVELAAPGKSRPFTPTAQASVRTVIQVRVRAPYGMPMPGILLAPSAHLGFGRTHRSRRPINVSSPAKGGMDRRQHVDGPERQAPALHRHRVRATSESPRQRRRLAGLGAGAFCTNCQQDYAGQAGYGYCASHSRYFWGMRLYLVTTARRDTGHVGRTSTEPSAAIGAI